MWRNLNSASCSHLRVKATGGQIVDHEWFHCVSTLSYKVELHAHTHTLAPGAQTTGPIFSLPWCHYGNPLLLLLSSQHRHHHSHNCPLLGNPLGCKETVLKHDWKEWIVGVAGGKKINPLKDSDKCVIPAAIPPLPGLQCMLVCESRICRIIVKCEQRPVKHSGTFIYLLFFFKFHHYLHAHLRKLLWLAAA